MNEAEFAIDFAATEELPIVREAEPLRIVAAPADAGVSVVLEPTVGGADEGNSDVFVCRRTPSELPPASPEAVAAARAAAEGVTLFVYGWHNVQPGPLSWAFPSLRAALDAVRTMRNAIEWSIVSGRQPSVDAARANGSVLVEQKA